MPSVKLIVGFSLTLFTCLFWTWNLRAQAENLSPRQVQRNQDVVIELEEKVLQLKQQNRLNSTEQATLKELRIRLKLAKGIRQQFVKAKAKKSSSTDDDAFVIADLEVAPGGSELEVRFKSIEGLHDSVRAVLDFVTETPDGGFRDFRIISRHMSASDAHEALEAARVDYDMAKEREQQFLQYIVGQRSALSSVNRVRRC